MQSVASIGNTLNSVGLAVEAIQKTMDEHKATLELLQGSVVRPVNTMGSQHALATFPVFVMILISHCTEQTLLYLL